MKSLPRPTLASSAPLFDPAKDLAQQRASQIASRRAFVDMKLGFIKIAAEARGAMGNRLQRRVRQAQDPADLIGLQQDLADALPQGSSQAERLRQELAQQLQRLFATAASMSSFGSLV